MNEEDECELLNRIDDFAKENAQLGLELAKCQEERDGACNVVQGANLLLLKAGERAARLREALEFIANQDKPGNWAVERAKRAIEEDKA